MPDLLSMPARPPKPKKKEEPEVKGTGLLNWFRRRYQPKRNPEPPQAVIGVRG